MPRTRSRTLLERSLLVKHWAPLDAVVTSHNCFIMTRVWLGVFFLIPLANNVGCISAFQPPTATRLARSQLNFGGNIPRVVVSLSKTNESDQEEESRLPFLSRALRSLRNKNVDKASEDTDIGGSHVDSEAAVLRALAERTRLEAHKMDLLLTLGKIEKLRDDLQNERDLEARNILLKRADVLMEKVNGPERTRISLVENAEIKEGATKSVESQSRNKVESNENGDKNIVQEILNGEKPLLSDDKRQDAVDAFEKLPPQIKDMMAKSVGMASGENATAVIEKLMAENRLYEGDNDENFSMIAKADDVSAAMYFFCYFLFFSHHMSLWKVEDIFVDLDFAEVNSFVESLLPEVTRKFPVEEKYIDAVYSEILGKDTFNPTGKPMAVPGGYLIRGESKVKPRQGIQEGDLLMEALDRKISQSSLAGKIQAHYLLDPTPPSGEEILNEEDETPVLFISNYDISPDTQLWVKPTVTFFGLASIATFALGSFSFNEEVLNQLSTSLDSGNGSLNFLYELSLPLALSTLAIHLLHEVGHLMIAVKDDIDIGFPTLIPSLQFGLTGGITPIKSPPKNIKSLFDFAISGPLFGLVASFFLLYLGLETTAFMDSSAQAQLPSVPVEILRSSSLGGAMVDYLLQGVLNSPDPSSEMIKLHPYAIAGFAGLVTNALSLLPIGNTDGGRICLCFFGRSFSRVVQGTTLLALVVAGLFGLDQVNTLLCYAVYCQFWQKEAEVPCRNEVDELDSARGFIAIAVGFLVILTLTPLP
ncbi:hypothetical protein ACHAWF_016929 [Thalassiosira exigua]